MLWMAGIFVLTALILLCSTFGNPDLGVDEQFYLLIGQRMHQGALPYVDVWDRKPLGLFVLYWLFTSLPDPVLSYQIAASLFAAATAWVIARMLAMCLSGPFARQGALLGGLTYLLLLGPFDGFGGQAPVFYNLFIAIAAALVLQHDVLLRDAPAPWRINLAMGLCGLAIAIKQTCFFESAFLGLWCAWALWRRELRAGAMVLPVLRWMALGLAPMALIGAWYAYLGHGAVWWHAMFTSSLQKHGADWACRASVHRRGGLAFSGTCRH